MRLTVDGLEKLPADSELEVFAAQVGSGMVYYVLDSISLSRKGLGHAFTLPSSSQKATIDMLGRILGGDRPAHARSTYGIVEHVGGRDE